MARIRWQGAEYTATPLRQLDNGNWRMKVRQHGPRFSAGSEIEVKPAEIVEMGAAEAPADDGRAALEAAMAEERKNLPSVQELLAAAREEKKPDGQ